MDMVMGAVCYYVFEVVYFSSDCLMWASLGAVWAVEGAQLGEEEGTPPRILVITSHFPPVRS